MAEKTDPSTSLGASLNEFTAAVSTLAKLRDSNRFLVYLVKDHWVSFVGDLDDFRVEYQKSLGEPSAVERRHVSRVLNEIKIYFQTLLFANTIQRATEFLQTQFLADELEAISNENDRKRAQDEIEKKVGIVSKSLRTASLRQRERRLENATTPSLSDITIETIVSRSVKGVTQEKLTPFLRIMFKYLKSDGFNLPLPPFASDPNLATSHFELECDETDIDFMISRLTLAKGILARSIHEAAKTAIEEVPEI